MSNRGNRFLGRAEIGPYLALLDSGDPSCCGELHSCFIARDGDNSSTFRGRRITEDVRGRKRGDATDLGCEELSDDAPRRGQIDPNDVELGGKRLLDGDCAAARAAGHFIATYSRVARRLRR